jgi:hypothetical protein
MSRPTPPSSGPGPMELLNVQGATPSDDPTSSPIQAARERAAEFRRREGVEARRSTWMSWLRLGTFLAVVVALLAAERSTGTALTVALSLAGAGAVLFLFLLGAHRRIRSRERHAAALAAVNEEAVLRIRRDWSALPDEPWGGIPPGHPEAEDLYILGRASLLRLVGPPATVPGRATLTSWLLAAAPPPVVRERQEAVKVLAPAVEFRDELAARGRTLAAGQPGDVEQFLTWAEGDLWVPSHRGLQVAGVIFPLLTAGLGWGHFVGALPALWLLPLLVTIVLANRCTRDIHARFDAASAGESGVRRYDTLLAHLEGTPAGAPLLDRLRETVTGARGEGSAHEAIASLRRILDTSETRRSMFGPALQMGALWDLHVLAWLERWQVRHGGEVRMWLQALGELEALAAMARLAHHHPHWAFPVLVPLEESGAGPVFSAKGLGHPLLAPERCVRNDVEVGPPGTLLLITGSNMSGKSTLLRAIGANCALAGAGAPVCAGALSLPPLRLATCMRVQDALDEGISLFMAELQRLRLVVERARSTPGTGQALLYLLDEMLQGTNTAERQVAARHILGHLLEAGAIGAVTTHDLALADSSELSGRAVPVHFRERVESEEGRTVLHFDYQLRPGPATSRNALRLLEAVGLGRATPPD